MRGWTQQALCLHLHRYVYPAYAGMDLGVIKEGTDVLCLPRICGDGPMIEAMMGSYQVFTPHTRGWFLCIVWEKKQIKVFHLPEQGISPILI